MVTYSDIQKAVKRRYGKTIKTCWIAHVKELNGLRLKAAPNRISRHHRRHPCPHYARPLIEAVLRQHGILPPVDRPPVKRRAPVKHQPPVIGLLTVPKADYVPFFTGEEVKGATKVKEVSKH